MIVNNFTGRSLQPLARSPLRLSQRELNDAARMSNQELANEMDEKGFYPSLDRVDTHKQVIMKQGFLFENKTSYSIGLYMYTERGDII